MARRLGRSGTSRGRATALGLAGALTLLGATGCSSDGSGDRRGGAVSNPGLPSPTGSTATSGAPTSQAPGDEDRVRVLAQVRVRSGPVTRTLTRFVAAHATSVIAGRPTATLRRVSTAAELRRQVAVVDYAVAHGLTVPARPRIAVVSSRRPSPDRAVLGVCLWLPSTEYVDELSGQPPNGPVPRQWLPAEAFVTRQTVTWRVDKLSATSGARVDCGGLQ